MGVGAELQFASSKGECVEFGLVCLKIGNSRVETRCDVMRRDAQKRSRARQLSLRSSLRQVQLCRRATLKLRSCRFVGD